MEKNKVIQLNSFRYNRDMIVEYIFLQDEEGSDVFKEVKFNQVGKLKASDEDDVVSVNVLKNKIDIDAIFEEMKNPINQALTERITLKHTAYNIVIDLTSVVDIEKDRLDGWTVTVEKQYILNKEKEILIYNIDNQKKYYIPGFNDVNKNILVYGSIFGYNVEFDDYSHAPCQYNGNSYISVNEGDKYPLERIDTMDDDIVTTVPISKDDIGFFRSIQKATEIYSSTILGMELYIENYQYKNKIDITIFYTGTKDIIVMDIVNKQLTKKNLDTDYSESMNMSNEFNINKMSDNIYHITLDLDWLPDLIELKDGFGNYFIVKKYKRLKVIKPDKHIKVNRSEFSNPITTTLEILAILSGITYLGLLIYMIIKGDVLK